MSEQRTPGIQIIVKQPPLKNALKYIAIASVFSVFPHAHALPDRIQGKMGDWEKLRDKGFGEWSVNFYVYKGVVADGGSHLFEFRTTKGDEFGILVAHPENWNDEELENGSQVFFILEGDIQKGRKHFKISIRSKEERDVIRILSAALAENKDKRGADSKMLEKLISHLKSRKRF